MPAIYNNTTKVSRMTAVRDAIDSGTGPGVLQIGTAGFSTVLAEITLNDPCATIDSNGVMTFSGFPKSDASVNASGVAAEARVQTSSGTTIISGLTVGTSNADIIVTGTNFYAGDIFQVTAFVITHA